VISRTFARCEHIVAALVLTACTAAGPPAPVASDPPYDVLVFAETQSGIQAVRDLGAANNFTVTATVDPTAITTGNLARFEAVAFLDTTGDVLDTGQRTALESYLRGGGGFVGVHPAAAGYDWPFYAELVTVDSPGRCRAIQSGRSFAYAGAGRWAEPSFRTLLLGGIRYAAGRIRADCRPETGYTVLYDGSTEGWSHAGPGGFRNDDSTLSSLGGLGILWYSAREFGSYSLKLDWRLAGDDNSGVFVGFPPGSDPGTSIDNGYEVQIDASDAPDRTTGAIYSFQSADIPARNAALNPPGEWNTFELLVEGERLQVFLNGVRINDFTNTDPARSLTSGHFGIQNHGDGDDVSFRNIRIKELSG
jgi:3-keto-disaccharide hydrolase/Trehalose utilisation